MTGKNKDAGGAVWRIVARHVFTPFNAFNFAIGACIAAVGAYQDMLYLVVVAANILIGIVQDIRSKRIVDKLSLLTSPSVRAVRGGKTVNIPPEALLQGETFRLKRGDQICADATVKDGVICVNEALLTGEADQIEKRVGDTLFSGSFVVAGTCEATADKIGEDCYAAKITRFAKKTRKNDSVILRSLNRIVRFTGLFIIPLGAVLFYQSYRVANAGLASSVTTTAAALLGLLPKGLVLLTSVSLAVGVIRLGKKNTLVQELYGIESLARVDVLCMDKTGTLTDAGMEFDGFISAGRTQPEECRRIARAFCHAFADDESAVMTALKKAFDADEGAQGEPAASFSSERAWSAIKYDSRFIYMGAPEKLMRDPSESIAAAQREGAHVLVFASSSCPPANALPQDLQTICAVRFFDRVRPDAAKTLRYFEDQGVRLVILSGDNVDAVASVARRAGFSGKSADADILLCDDAPVDAIEEYSVFGRVKPEQKLAFVKALQQKGHTVGMLGDGVNDVLAIRQADCGVALASGCDAARRAARLVLMDNSFASLPGVVGEGRRVVNNIRRVAAFFLTKTCFSFMLSLICAITMMQYPFKPLQLSIYSILFEALPALILTFRANAARIQGDIVKDAIRRAVPYAAAVTAGALAAQYIGAAEPSVYAFIWMCGVGAALVLRVMLEGRGRQKRHADELS